MKKLLLAVSGLLLSTQIHAAGCTAANLNGNYVMYQNSVAAANLHTGSCKIAVVNGALSGTCAFVSTVNGVITPGFTGAVNGTGTMNSNCSASMVISFSPAPGVNISSTFDLQFTPDKQSFIGQWTNNFGLLGTSAGTRYSPLLPSTPAP